MDDTLYRFVDTREPRPKHVQWWRALAPALEEIPFEYKLIVLIKHIPEDSWKGAVWRKLCRIPQMDRAVSAAYALAGESEYINAAATPSADFKDRSLAQIVKDDFAHTAFMLCGPQENGRGKNICENLRPLPLYENARVVAFCHAGLAMVNVNGTLTERFDVSDRTSGMLRFRGIHPGAPSDDDNVKWTSGAIFDVPKDKADQVPAAVKACMEDKPYNALGKWDAANCGTCIPQIADFIGLEMPPFFRQKLPRDVAYAFEKEARKQPEPRPGNTIRYIGRQAMGELNAKYEASLRSQPVWHEGHLRRQSHESPPDRRLRSRLFGFMTRFLASPLA